MKKNIILTVVILTALVLAIITGFYFQYQKNISENSNKVNLNENKLEKINKYQERYFVIIRRNDALLNLTNSPEVTQDLKELKNLFDEVKENINQDCTQYKEYETLKTLYKENTGQTTFEMNEFMIKKHSAFDKLLNDTYKEIKDKIPHDDFEALKQSEQQWLKEVEDYNKVYLSKGFGTIGTLIKYDYLINMICFRTLLLMIYL